MSRLPMRLHLPRHSRRSLGAVSLAALAFAAACSDATTAADPSVAFAKAPARTNTVQVNISGLPSGVAASVVVTGSGGFSRTLTASASLTNLTNGSYTATASSVSSGGVTYVPQPTTQTVSVNKGSTQTMSVAYAAVASTGALNVSITIPGAVAASVIVTGPNSFSQSLSGSQSIGGLAPGSYTVTAAVVTSGSVTYTPTPLTQVASVTAGGTAQALVTYTGSSSDPSGLNLQIAGMYLTQSVQTMAGAVPMVVNRDAMLRVFAVASASNSAQPVVRARVYRNGTLVSTLTASAPATAVPTTVNEGSVTASWNIPVPASLVQGGLSIIADVDPDNTVAESNEGDNQFPASGALAIDVRNVPALAVRFVPVLQSATGQTGGVSDANTAAFLTRTRDMHPLNTVTSSVRAPYTTSTTITNSSNEWSSVLSELYALRTADGSSANYYGVAKVGYTSGIAGIGYIGAPAALGWDYLPSASEVMAHELGHNWGRQHAPCGGVSGADGAFPYSGGVIGAYGFNVRTGQLLSNTTADLMGYCNPTWISDYTYRGVMNFRGTSVASLVVAADEQPGVLVWGRVDASGRIELEPALSITGRPSLPSRSGTFRIDATDANGASLFTLAFEPDQVALEDGQGDRHFAFLVPLSAINQERMTNLTVSGGGQRAVRSSRTTKAERDAAADVATVGSVAAGRSRIRWNSAEQPMVMVRDAATRQVLSFARGGDASIVARADSVELVYTDGVRSTTRRVRVRQ